MLHSALKWAMKQHLVKYNAAALTEMPEPPKKEVRPYSTAQCRQLIKALDAHRLGVIPLVGMVLGGRIGEVLGLKWADIDLDRREIRFRQQLQRVRKQGQVLMPLKTPKSRRTLTLPVMVATRLKKWRTTQRADRLRAGANWKNDVGSRLHHGGWAPGVSGVRAAAGARSRAQGGGSRAQGLSHAATLGGNVGDGHENMFNVSRMLGHADIATTTDTYGHWTTEAAGRAPTRMDALLARK